MNIENLNTQDLLNQINELQNELQRQKFDYESMNFDNLKKIEELEKKNEKLELAEKKYEAAFFTSPDSININKIDGTYIDINEGFTNLTGYTREDVIGVLSSEIKIWNIPDDRQKLIEGLQKNGSISNLESDFRCKDGSIKRAIMSAQIIKINEEPHILSVTKDITEKKKIENKLIETEEIFSKFLEHSPIYVFFKDTEIRPIRLSKNYENMLGMPISEILGKTMDDLFPSDLAKNMIQDDINVLNKGEILKVVENLNDNYFETIKFPIFKDGNPQYLAGFTIDITEQKTAEIKLKENQRKLIEKNREFESLNEELRQINDELFNAKRKAEEINAKNKSLLEAIPDFMFFFDQYGNILDCHANIEDELYTEKQFIIGRNIVKVVPSWLSELTLDKIKETINSKKLTIYTYELEIKGEIQYFESRLTYVEGDKILAVVRNITERIKTINELKIAKETAEESNRLKTAFLQNMSHEIRTPMNAICGFSEMLISEDFTNEKRKSISEIIINSSYQLLSIINDILTIASLETGQENANIQQVNINSILLNLLADYKSKTKNHNISIYLKQQLNDYQSNVYTDEDKFHRILSNLLSNAIKFTHTGTVEFGYQLVKVEKSSVLQFYVKDTGIGISHDMFESIFERFTQADVSTNRNYGGTGLGLAISKGFAELLGGKMWLTSELGIGSTFYFTIPYKTDTNSGFLENQDSYFQEQPENYSTILVVEDEEFNFLFIEEILKNSKINIIHAKNGKEAVDFCRQNSEIDIVIMDLKLPVLDGYTATKIIKQFRPNLIIIAYTAYALPQDEAKADEFEFDSYISKPISRKKLLETIEKYIKI